MTQRTLEKLNRNIYNLQREIEIFRSFIIGFLGRDNEGKYRPDFVKRILKGASEDVPLVFRDKKSFLKKIQK